MRLDKEEKVVLGFAVVATILNVAFWVVVIAVAWHFIHKLW